VSHSYRPIGDHAIIGNLRSAALVAPDGAIDWCCLPDFDSPSVFAALLDHKRGGRFRVGLPDAPIGHQRYITHSNVLETTFQPTGGRLVVTDFMPLGGDLNEPQAEATAPRIWRLLHADGGAVEAEVEWAPRPDYARGSTRVERLSGGFRAWAGEQSVVLAGLADHELVDGILVSAEDGQPAVRARLQLASGERRVLVCALGEEPFAVDIDEGWRLRRETVQAWRDWLHKIGVAERAWARPYQDLVTRSELALKLMCYPSGAIVAAPTTSLPEEIGGVRNWDYRYSWIRDAALAVRALHSVGHEDEARRFILWSERMAEQRTDAPEPVQIMYGIRGDTELPEDELHHLEGYRRSAPVRIGNGAAKQKQLDVYGELLDGAYQLVRDGDALPPDVWRFLSTIADGACGRLEEPDEGIWEVRSGEHQFTYSKLMLWVGLDRAVRMAEGYGLRGDVARWRRSREEARAMVLERGYNAQLGAFTQLLDGAELDASLLLIAVHGLLPGDDPRMLSTIDRILEQLTDHGLVYRYHADDGLPGGEGAFVLCSFWLVDALALAGRLDEAEGVFDGLIRRANHVGLFSEQIDPATGEFLGNFPQAFSHLGLIDSAIHIAEARGHGPDPRVRSGR
jgi:GH15 family glucan-1,4-alpha-glucosidase